MPPRGNLGYQYASPFSDTPRGIEGNLTIWRGPALPLSRLDGGRLRSGNLKDVVKSSMIMILGTPVGSVFHNPEFGSYIPEILFEPNDDITTSLAETYTREALEKWEPRVSLSQVSAFASSNSLEILIVYYIKDQGTIDQLALSSARFAPAALVEITPSLPTAI